MKNNTMLPDKIRIKSFVKHLPVYGCFSTGLIYFGIGVIAILSYLQIKKGGADESSLLAFLHESFTGKIIFWAILLGTLCYVIWRIFESIKDPYGYGKSPKGIALRMGIAMSTVPDALIALTGVQILLGAGNIQLDGRPVELREMVASILEHSSGDVLVIVIGVIVCVSGFVQFFYGISRGYKERLDIDHFSANLKWLTHFLAWIGYLSRGIILSIIGFFFAKSGIARSSEYVVNTDKAFDFIGDNVGHLFFILVAIGTVGYGLFMAILGWFYDPDKD